MNRIRASAPGKLMLIGEYAVLDGSPALVMAVDRYVEVRVGHALSGTGRLNAPQLGLQQALMHIRDGQLTCEGASPMSLGLTGRLLPRIFQALGRAPEEIAALDIEIDSGALFESYAGNLLKLGLGSSAAVCAALALALGEWFEGPSEPHDPDHCLKRWLPVYRDSLGARASGADLAAALFGGFSEIRATGDAACCRPAAWPEGLYWSAVWTRQPAQTTDFVGRFEAWKRADPVAAARIWKRLDRIATHAARAAGPQAQDAEALLDACAAYARSIADMGEAMEMEIMTPAHQRLAERASACGLVYKSCGAGGGDLGIVLARDPDRLRAFELGIADCDGVPLNLALSASGSGVFERRLSRTGEQH